jgi:soluble lytic murein transglycosylase-like protein
MSRGMIRAAAILSASLLFASTASAQDAAPDAREAAIAAAAKRSGLPRAWIVAVMHAESGGDARAVSRAGAMGLMQLMPATWRALRARLRLGTDPFHEADNLLAGAVYLRELHDQFGAPGFLAAYNAGPGRYAQVMAGRARLPTETRAYLAKLSPLLGPRRPSPSPRLKPWTEAPLFTAAEDETTASALFPASWKSAP